MTRMRTAVLVLAFLAIAGGAQQARAQAEGLGVGVILGEPTGFSLKSWLDGRTAIDAGLAWSFFHETTFHIHGDYLIHTLEATDRSDVPLYYGIGGRIKTGGRGDDRIGVRVVGGLVYYIPDAPVDLFVEIAPILDFAPETELQLNGGVGARYFFR